MHNSDDIIIIITKISIVRYCILCMCLKAQVASIIMGTILLEVKLHMISKASVELGGGGLTLLMCTLQTTLHGTLHIAWLPKYWERGSFAGYYTKSLLFYC